MKYLLSYCIESQNIEAASNRFMETQAAPPEGVT
jgi:hypothetical protein